MIILIQQIALLIGTLSGAITDIKTGYIYDWITYPMIILGIITSLILGQTTNLILGAGIFGILFFAYKFGKIGGGDVKIYTGIALLNPFNDINYIFTAALVAATLSMMFYSVYFAIKYLRKGIDWKENKQGLTRAGMLGVALIAYFTAMGYSGIMNPAMIYFLGIPFMFGLVFLGLQKGITKEFFQKKILVSKIEEDEIIVEDYMSEKMKKILKGKVLIGPKEAKLLQKNGIKNIIVMRDLPKFGPFIFLGVAFALMYPNFFSLLLG